MRSAPSGSFRVRRRRPPVTAFATALLLVTGLMGTAVGQTLGAAPAAAGAATAQVSLQRSVVGEGNVVTPGDFTGYGFDQCHAPDQRSMNKWLTYSPFLAVGIYISGNSRACRDQPNLTPEWISTQLAKGWRLLPITLGPQASCQPRFPRYQDDPKINPKRGTDGLYSWARAQGAAEASKTVGVAQSLGIVAGSTMWYDLEGFNDNLTDCRESALAFTSAWTKKLHALDYVSGVYSSAASGIKALDDARANRPGAWTLPDRVWIADWDQDADTSSAYIRSDGWQQGNRMKQYVGGHNETYGGVTINIDRDFLDLGAGSAPGPEPTHCGGVRLNFLRYPTLHRSDTGELVTALQCLLRWQKFYSGELDGVMSAETRDAVSDYRVDHGMTAGQVAGPRVWTSLHSQGDTSVMKYGAASEQVRRLQRALDSASAERLPVTGIFEAETTAAVKRYQSQVGADQTGVVTPRLWAMLQSGKV